MLVISPHLDDAALSTGGVLWRTVRSGEPVRVVTVFAGIPTKTEIGELAVIMHDHWGLGDDAMELRRAEDVVAMDRLGASPIHLDFRDVIYTGPRQRLFGSPAQAWSSRPSRVIDEMARTLVALTQDEPGVVMAPAGAGGHVDHVLVRELALQLVPPARLQLYEDVPYAYDDPSWTGTLGGGFVTAGHETVRLTAEEWDAKIEACAAYGSQIALLWDGEQWPHIWRDRCAAHLGANGERFWRVARGAAPAAPPAGRDRASLGA